jgi:hypothetical protein
METTYKGIDYGLGMSNKDKNNIRYGVISQNQILQAWADSSEGIYIYTCPYCGSELDHGSDSVKCQACGKDIDPDTDFDFMEPIGYMLDDGEYCAESDDYGDIFVTKAPYYTYAQFCSPCAPGACYLENPLSEPDNDNKCYCFGHDWFDEGRAPYTVYDIKTGEVVEPE